MSRPRARRRAALSLVVIALAAFGWWWAAKAHRAGDATPDSAAAVPRFDGALAYRYVKTQCAFGPRGNGLPGHERALAWYQDTLRAAGFEVSLQPFTHVRRGARAVSHFANVIARYDANNPRRVFLGGHFDTRLWADNDPEPAFHADPLAGANDGASGPAVILALAALFAQHPPPCGVDVVLFDGEDFGRREGADWARDYFLGSRFFAANPPDWPTPLWGAVLDLVGDRSLSLLQERLSLERAPETVARLWNAARAEKLGAFIDRPGAAITDDHVALIETLDWPVALLCQHQPFPATWHTHQDTVEQVSEHALSQVGQALTCALYTTTAKD